MIGPLLMGAAIGAFLMWLAAWLNESKDRVHTDQDVRKLVRELYREIEHGDADHRIWLWDKMKQFMDRKGIR